uniref:Uncharacterized protein n=1 Tax=Triticum urartu TaxID=4572 RepID=A0A8R7TC15_TRIUA
LAAVDDVVVAAGLGHVAEHDQHQGDQHGQQEPLGVQPHAAPVAAAVVVLAAAADAAARSRPHGDEPLCHGEWQIEMLSLNLIEMCVSALLLRL